MSIAKTDFIYLSESDMIRAGVTDMARCVEEMEEVLKLLAKGDYMMSGSNHNSHGAMVSFPDEPEFPNMPKNGPDRRFMAMPAYVGGKYDMAGMKWYGSNVENGKKGLPRSILMLMLNDKDTGEPKALMSANLISAYRTGAIPAVGVKHLAPAGAKVLGIVGPGNVSKAMTEAFCTVCPTLEKVKVNGRSTASLERYQEFVKTHCLGVKEIEVVETMEAAVRDSDIVGIATSSPVKVEDYPFIEEAWIKPGALLCLPATVNFSDDFIAHRCKKVVDNMGLYDAWAEEFPYPTFGDITIIGSKFTDMIHEGKLKREDVVNIGDILSGNAIGRRDEKEIILYSVGGMPVEDVAWGKVIYDNAIEKGIGVNLNLWNGPAML